MADGLEIVIIIIAAVVSYFIGNISPATVMGKIYGVDIRKQGSGNPGTTNVLRTLGKKAAAVTLLIDIMKGFLPTLIAMLVYGRLCAIVCGTAAFLGHLFPVVYRFKGGKGIATGFGILLALDWHVGLMALAFAIMGFLLSRRVSVGSIAACVVLPIAVYVYMVSGDEDALGFEIVWAVCVSILVLYKHRENIKRLIKHEEPPTSLFSKKEKPLKTEKSEEEY